MRTIYYVTPWHGQTAQLIAEYAQATDGGVVIAVDNGTPPETAQALQQQAWKIIRNDLNAGFAVANNQGWDFVQSRAAGEFYDDDIVCFVNSDVRAGGLTEALLGNVQHGSLYGPSLNMQMVLGHWMPYLEGWCVAATVHSWSLLGDQPWPAEYIPAYWEDNALSLRALRAGIDLVHLQLPIQHLGGQSGGVAQAGEAYEANRARYVAEVRDALRDRKLQSSVRGVYQHWLAQQTDIQHHLPLLNAVARGNVVELGTRMGVSTAALLEGVERHGGRVVSIDIADCSALFRGHPQWVCIQSDSRHPNLPATVARELGTDAEQWIDVLLVDTEHTYDQVTAELELWWPLVRVGGYVLAHDTETFPGVRAAIEDWLQVEHGDVHYVLPCNGMAVIRKRA
jgi:hypothetical protein